MIDKKKVSYTAMWLASWWADIAIKGVLKVCDLISLKRGLACQVSIKVTEKYEMWRIKLPDDYTACSSISFLMGLCPRLQMYLMYIHLSKLQKKRGLACQVSIKVTEKYGIWRIKLPDDYTACSSITFLMGLCPRLQMYLMYIHHDENKKVEKYFEQGDHRYGRFDEAKTINFLWLTPAGKSKTCSFSSSKTDLKPIEKGNKMSDVPCGRVKANLEQSVWFLHVPPLPFATRKSWVCSCE